jgi:hypothetical protein
VARNARLVARKATPAARLSFDGATRSAGIAWADAGIAFHDIAIVYRQGQPDSAGGGDPRQAGVVERPGQWDEQLTVWPLVLGFQGVGRLFGRLFQ